jgi:hypothetical protein
VQEKAGYWLRKLEGRPIWLVISFLNLSTLTLTQPLTDILHFRHLPLLSTILSLEHICEKLVTPV